MAAVGISDANFPKTCSRSTEAAERQKQGQHCFAPLFSSPSLGKTMKKGEMMVVVLVVVVRGSGGYRIRTL